MMNEEAKEMYYIAKRNINKYIKYDNGYYRIIGFHYDAINKGFIVISSTINTSYYCIECDWIGNNKIFLSQKDKKKHRYFWVSYPLDKDYKIVNNKYEE